MIDLIIFLVLITVGYLSGSMIEKNHFKRLREEESKLRVIPVYGVKRPSEDFSQSDVQFVEGSVVISIDYFKRIAAALRNLLGGRVSAYETLVERARREATVRLKQQAQNWGAQAIFNLKLETSSISQGTQGQIGAVEVYAYATALKPIDISGAESTQKQAGFVPKTFVRDQA